MFMFICVQFKIMLKLAKLHKENHKQGKCH